MNPPANLLRIEHEVPVPRGALRSNGRYPFRFMRVGDSFMVERPEHEIKRTWNSLTSCRQWASYKTGFVFTMRRVLGGIRVWRIR